eukprot:g1134.t1
MTKKILFKQAGVLFGAMGFAGCTYFLNDDKVAFADSMGERWIARQFDAVSSRLEKEVTSAMPPVFSRLAQTLDRFESSFQNFSSPHILSLFYVWRDSVAKAESVDERARHSILGHWLCPSTRELRCFSECLEIADASYEENRATLLKRMKGLGFHVHHHQEESDTSGVLAHFLAVDEDRKLVVVGVSGTKDPLDVATDASLHSVPFNWRSKMWHFMSRSRKEKAHAGILHASEQLLHLHADKLHEYAKEGYKIRLIGHSLGGGCTALMAIQLRKSVPNVEAIGFGTPPCVTLRCSKLCDAFVTTVVCNDDMVPRTNGHSIIKLLNRLIEFPWQEKWNADVENFLGMDDSILSTGSAIKEGKSKEEKKLIPEPPVDHRLYPPGKIVHIYRVHKIRKLTPLGIRDLLREVVEELKNDEEETRLVSYGEPREAAVMNPEHWFDEIRISKRMLADHSRKEYRKSLNYLLRRLSLTLDGDEEIN